MIGTATTIASVIALFIVGSLLLASGAFIKPMTDPWSAFASTAMIWGGWAFIVSIPAYVVAVVAIRVDASKKRAENIRAESKEKAP